MMGEPAFPLFIPYGKDDAYQASPGMSLRDWFAGQALYELRVRGILDIDADLNAQAAYRMADAMLKARESAAIESGWQVNSTLEELKREGL